MVRHISENYVITSSAAARSSAGVALNRSHADMSKNALFHQGRSEMCISLKRIVEQLESFFKMSRAAGSNECCPPPHGEIGSIGIIRPLSD